MNNEVESTNISTEPVTVAVPTPEVVQTSVPTLAVQPTEEVIHTEAPAPVVPRSPTSVP